jgi:V/A-type H+-transporting ATPase subunit E
MTESTLTGSGVQELINQIRNEGVEAARQEAEKLIREAKETAAAIRQQAKAEAETAKTKAAQEIAAEKSASLEALQLAARDTVLRLSREVMDKFSSHVKRLVAAELKDENVLRDMLVALAGKSAGQIPAGQGINILLSEAGTGEDRLRQFILKITRDMLREGIEIKPSSDRFEGLRVRMKNEDLEIDLTEKAVTGLLLEHLLPRYSKIVRGLE